MTYRLYNDDCLKWLSQQSPAALHAIVTDPPFALKEYTEAEKTKLRAGSGGVWRQPPVLGGHQRSPLPRFTVLTAAELRALFDFMCQFATACSRVLVPGAHVIIATHPLLSHCVYTPFMAAGFEKRGELIRLVQTLRGGDRPKGAEKEFDGVSVMPRSQYEPWGVFRKPCEGTVAANLRKYGTGGLRRISGVQPFGDVIKSSPTRAAERALSPHPSLKPQEFMRAVVHASLPLGEGVVLDPFMGGGSTIAAAFACGYESIGVELDSTYFKTAVHAIPKLAQIKVNAE